MSTRAQDSIPFAIAREQQSFRLLELPDELLHLLTSPAPPVLAIKSSGPAVPDVQSTKPAYAVLCTPHRTYQLRQVQTSNSVFITHPVPCESNSDETPPSGICALATCNATLELHPLPNAALAHLIAALPVWHGRPDSLDVDLSARGATRTTQHDVFASIPFSDGECAVAWTHLCAFTHGNHAFVPSSRILTQLWHAILSAALADGIDLSSSFLVRDLLAAVADEGYPPALLAAVVARLLPEGEDVGDGWARVDRDECVRWTGTVILEACGGGGMGTAEFVEAWRDSLPETWRGEARLEKIKNMYILPSSSTVAIRPDDAPADAQDGATGPGKKAAGMRKWHDKFRRARN